VYKFLLAYTNSFLSAFWVTHVLHTLASIIYVLFYYAFKIHRRTAVADDQQQISGLLNSCTFQVSRNPSCNNPLMGTLKSCVAMQWLVHWLLTGGMTHLLQWGGAWTSCRPVQSSPSPHCTKCNSPPINRQCTNFILFNVKQSKVTVDLNSASLRTSLRCATASRKSALISASQPVQPGTSTTM